MYRQFRNQLLRVFHEKNSMYNFEVILTAEMLCFLFPGPIP